MTTEQELKERCTPDIIKRMVELAEGFSWRDYCGDYKIYTPIYQVHNDIKSIFENGAFPLLIHRAVEGWNNKNEGNIVGYYLGCVYHINKDNVVINYYHRENQYQPQSLTQCECAMLDCLLDIFEEENK